MSETITIAKVGKSYAEEPWNPFWEYELHWTGDYIETYEERVKELGKDNSEFRLKKLQEAVDNHEKFKRTHEKIIDLIDEELYEKRKEVEG